MIKVLSAIFGGMIIVATGVLQLTKAYENWINYRSTAEQLKQEYHLFALEQNNILDKKIRIQREDFLSRELNHSSD